MVTISLRVSIAGDWGICRSNVTLFSDMKLGPAIALARELGRDEHCRTGRHVCVEMPGQNAAIVLARYTDRLHVRPAGMAA